MGTVSRKLTAAVLGAAAVGGALLPTTNAVAAPAAVPTTVTLASQAGRPPVTLDVYTNGLQILGKLTRWIVDLAERAQNRPGYVKGLMEGAFYSADMKHNVMVVKHKHPYDSSKLQGVGFDAVVRGGGYPDFRIFVFESGTFVNHGDGGYINWAYQGTYYRPNNGNTVHFYKR